MSSYLDKVNCSGSMRECEVYTSTVVKSAVQVSALQDSAVQCSAVLGQVCCTLSFRYNCTFYNEQFCCRTVNSKNYSAVTLGRLTPLYRLGFRHIQDATGLLGSCGCYGPRPLLLEKDNEAMQERQEASVHLVPPWFSQGCHGHGSEGWLPSFKKYGKW